MTRILLFLSIFFIAFNSFAQTVQFEILVIDKESKTPLPGSSVYFEELNVGITTNTEGIAIFNNIPKGEQEITISYISYQTIETIIDVDYQSQFVFELEPGENELEEVIVKSTRSTRTIENIPVRVELIGAEELGEKAMMNPTNISMVLRESTGIQMQQTSLSSINTNIRIQGLDGRYTQLLRDGFPLYGGFAGGLSILQIPPLDIQQFEIIKGSASTFYGGGAIAGLVNIVSKIPEEEPTLDIMYTQTHAKGSTANVFYSKRNDKFAYSLYASGHLQEAYDPESDGFSNIPQTKAVSLNPKLYYFPSEKTSIWFGINGTYDERIGGDITKIESGTFGKHQFTEENISKRLSSQAVFETELDSNRSLKVKNSVVFFDRNLQTTAVQFSGKQTNTFSELSYHKNTERKEWVLGVNLYSSDFVETKPSSLQRDQKNISFGTFFNHIYDISEKWIFDTGIRVDYHKDYNVIPLPRIALLYQNNKGFTSRIGGGLGYKIPDMFTDEAEQLYFNNVLPVDLSTLELERSYGLNFDINYKRELFDMVGFSFNQLFYVSTIENGLLLNQQNDGFYVFENATDNILSEGAETNMKFTYKNFRWFLNYAFINTELLYLAGNPEKSLTAKHNAGSVFMYESEKWRIGYEIYYTGNQFLSNGIQTSDFITNGLLVMRSFEFGNLFVNFENIGDFRQSQLSPVSISPSNVNEYSEIYAPTDGFIFSTGVLIKPFGNVDD